MLVGWPLGLNVKYLIAETTLSARRRQGRQQPYRVVAMKHTVSTSAGGKDVAGRDQGKGEV